MSSQGSAQSFSTGCHSVPALKSSEDNGQVDEDWASWLCQSHWQLWGLLSLPEAAAASSLWWSKLWKQGPMSLVPWGSQRKFILKWLY